MAHWIYKSELTPDTLEQGDVLRATESLQALLQEYHPYYASHRENRFYIVLTQSCDLVKRQGGECGARYISLAPVRTLKKIVQYEFESKLTNFPRAPAFSNSFTRTEVERFLERLFNNNEASYFYLEAEPGAGLYESMCGMLALPISFRAEHYDVFLRARILGIDDVFQAKLGWLMGQLFSRVGTRDFEPDELKKRVADVTETLAIWLPDSEAKSLKALVEKHAGEHGVPIDRHVLDKLIDSIPKKKRLVIDRVLDVATDIGLVANPSGQRFKFRKALDNDAIFSGFF